MSFNNRNLNYNNSNTFNFNNYQQQQQQQQSLTSSQQQHQLLQLHLQQQAQQQAQAQQQRYKQFNYNPSIQLDDNQINNNTTTNNNNINNNVTTIFDKDMYLNPQLSLPQNNDEFFVSPHSSISSISKDSLLSNNTLYHTQSLNQNQIQYNSNSSNSNSTSNSNFNLPLELQGGVNNIFNRRPSYAADLHTSNNNNNNSNNNNNNLNINSSSNNTINSSSIDKHFPLQYNNYFNNQRNEFYDIKNKSLDLPSNSIQFNRNNNINGNNNISLISDYDPNYIPLDDGLLLNKSTNTIITSPELKRQFNQCSTYFGDFDTALKIIDQLNLLLGLSNNLDKSSNIQLNIIQHRINKLLEFLLKQNNDLKSSHHINNKNYSLILNKNGRLDIISFPKNSNLQLMPKDLIIIEGDRGKDLVMVLKPIIEFKFALFFNYLKKKLHLKSLQFGNNPSNKSTNNQNNNNNNNHNHHNNNNGQKSIINEDENFITLPNKQILRFAKPHELHQLISKYNDEVMAYRICLNYSASLNLDLIIKNVEFQFDKKKLIIYYYCLQRLDFRGLIKELFKIYKTRIWLCAILPLEKSFKPLLDYELEKRDIQIDKLSESNNTITNTEQKLYRSNSNVVNDTFPSSDQIYQFNEISEPIYFHCKIFSNLINMFQFEISNYEIFKDSYWFLDE